MVQLVFDASTPAEALQRAPVEVGYSQHEGAERAAWDDDKLERVDGTHPVVHPGRGLARELLRRGALPRQLRRGGRRLRRHARADVRRPADRADDPERSSRRRARASRGSGSRAAGASSSPRSSTGPTGPEPEDAVDGADHAGREGWRDRSYTVPVGSAFGPGGDRLLLRRRRQRLAGARQSGAPAARVQPACSGPRCSLLIVVPRARDVAADRSAPRRPPARVGPDPERVLADVRPAPAALPRDRRAVAADLVVVILVQTLVLHATSFAGVQTVGENNGLRRLLRPRGRHGADAARSRLRAGGDGAGAGRDRPRTARRRRCTPTAWRSTASARCSARC